METKGYTTLSRISTYNGYAITIVTKVYNPYDKRWHMTVCKVLECNYGDTERAYKNSVLISPETIRAFYNFMKDDNGYNLQTMRKYFHVSSAKCIHMFITHDSASWK